MNMNNNVEATLKPLRLSRQESLRLVHLSKKAFEQSKGKCDIESLTCAFERLKPILAEYMKENEIFSLDLDLENGDFETVEPISHGEREMWVSSWLQGELTTKQLLKEIRDYRKYHFQTVAHGYGFDQFLREMERWLKDN